ncbi:MAG: hypothetical protein U5O39_04360 [Gammaproteobacteria bacterium]|nr:hypothetical protein [Gammaproteobacteria bacterium]
MIYGEVYLFFQRRRSAEHVSGRCSRHRLLRRQHPVPDVCRRRLHRRETEVFTLEQINQLVVDQMRTGVVVVSSEGEIKLINAAGKELLTTPERASTIPDERLPYRLVEN